MSQCFPAIVVALATTIAVAGDPRSAKEQRDLVQGTWYLVEQTIDGQVNPNKFIRYELTFSGDDVELAYDMEDGRAIPGKHGPAPRKFRFTINSATTPKEINWFGNRVLVQGVYDCTGDTLAIAQFGRPEIARPSSLDSDKTSRPIHSPHVHWLLKRKTTTEHSVSVSRPAAPQTEFLELSSVREAKPSPVGFSNIHNVDSWSPDELRQQGITVEPWKHDTQTEEPPVDWARVAFDTSHVSNYQSVLMTAWFRTGRGELQSASRVQTTKDEPQVLQLLIAIGQTDRNRSSLEIVIWQETASGAKEAYGYKLSAERIGELVRQASKSTSQK